MANMARKVPKMLLALLSMTTVLLFSQSVTAMPSQEKIAQFKADYRSKVDSWLDTKSESTSWCIEALLTQLDRCRHEPYMQMMQYSLHAIGDLGDRNRCEELDVESAYTVVSLNVSTTPVFIRQGICLPSNCTQGMYNGFGTKVSSTLTSLVQKAVVKFDIGLYILPPDTRVELSFVDTSTVYSKSAYNEAVLAADGSGSNDDVPGVYGPATSTPLFWIITILVTMWTAAILAISIVYFQQKRVKERKLKQQQALDSQRKGEALVHKEDQVDGQEGLAGGAAVTLLKAESHQEFYPRILSIQYSLAQLMKPRGSSPQYDDLKMMDGMRVLCLLWVMMLGVCQFTMSSAVYNPWTLQQYFQTYAYTAVYSSNLGFDEFFFFSALLMTLKVADHLEESGSRNELSVFTYLRMLLLRYLRLAPVYYLIFLVGWQVGPYFGDGPCWFTYEKGFNNCGDYWWSVFTMTINFVPGYVIANEGCYYWGWYPPCELQLFVFTPWIAYLILKIKSPLWQCLAVSLGVLAGIGVNFYVIWANEMAAGLFAPQDVLIFKLFVIKPYTKLHAVFLGIGMALIYKCIVREKSPAFEGTAFWRVLAKSKLFALVTYVLALIAIGFVTLYPLPANKNPVKWSNLHNSLFISLSRPLFIIALMAIMICMALDHGRILKTFFSLQFWVPVSRLSYIVYLVFPMVNATLISSMSQALFLSYYTMFYLLAFNFVFCVFLGFLVHLFIEGPLMNLILARKIKAAEGEARLQENLKLLDKTVRKNEEQQSPGSSTSKDKDKAVSETLSQRQRLLSQH